MKYGFSRKHYEIVAKALRNADLPPGYREKIATEIADGFILDNQFFDRKRFMNIIMVGESKTNDNSLQDK